MRKGNIRTRVRRLRGCFSCFQRARWFLKTTALTVVIAFLGLYLQPVALAAHQAAHAPKPQARTESNEEKLSRTLGAVEDRLEKLDAKLSRRQAAEKEKAELKTLRQDLDAQDRKALADFDAIEKHLKDKNLPQVILDRHYEAVRTYKQEMGTLKGNLTAVEDETDDVQREVKVRKAKEHLKTKHKKRARKPLDPNNLPTRTLKPNSNNKPKLTKDQFIRAGLHNNPAMKVAVLGDFTYDKLSGANDPTYLAETIEIVISDAIKAKAEELERSPVKIYNWIYANTNWLPTWGAIQNSDTVMRTQKGNAFDLASLLIALLRASGFPARYVHGTIEIPADRFMNWAGGFTDPAGAQDLASAAGIPITAVTSGGKIVAFRMEHVWVETALDFYPSGGAINNSADTWIQLDPSFKQYVTERGYDMHARLNFDGEQFMMDYILNGADGTPYQHYSKKVVDYLNVNLPDWTLEDLYGRERVSPLKPAVGGDLRKLAASLPYKMLARGYSAATIPASLRHKVSVEIANNPRFGPDATYTVALSELGLERLTLSYIPESAADDAVVDDYGSIFASPAYLVRVKPVFRHAGTSVAVGAGTRLGEKQTLTLSFQSPTVGIPPVINQITAGSYSAIVVQGAESAIGASSASMQQLAKNAELNEQGFLDLDGTFGQLLHSIGIMWFLDITHERDFIATTMHVAYTQLPSEIIVTGDLNVSYFLGIPRTALRGIYSVDADRDALAAAAKEGESARIKGFMLAIGMTGSAWEHIELEPIFGAPAASAVSLLRLAADQGEQIYKVDSSNIIQVLPLLRLASEDISDISAAVSAGKIAVVSRSEVLIGKYRGAGIIIYDPIRGDGLYLLSGGLAGGWSACGTENDHEKECTTSEWESKVASRKAVAKVARDAITRWGLSKAFTPYSFGCRDPRNPPTYWCRQRNADGSPKDFDGIDCSGLVAYAYSRVGFPLKGPKGEDLNAAGQYAILPHYPTASSVGRGDLVFWQNTYKVGISHIGIFLTLDPSTGKPFSWIAAQSGMVGVYLGTDFWNTNFFSYGSVFNP